MLRRVSFSAALAALAVPLVLAGSSHADPGPTPVGDPGDQAQLRKQQVAPARKAAVSRRANRGKARAKDDAPLSVTIEKLTPSSIPDKGVVRVSGFVTNNDTETWSTINVRPFISSTPLTTALQLAEAAAMPPDAVVGDRINDERHKGFIEELAPGDSAPYTISIPRKLLHVSTPGVYWFGVHALGEGPQGRDETADGRARTLLPLVPEARPGQEPVAVVIPLRHQLLYTDDGSVDDLAGWIQTLSPGGRLRSLVDFGASAGDRTVTWVVDPALIDTVRRLADGNPPRSLEPNLKAGEADGEDASPDPSESTSPRDAPTESPSAEPEATAPSSPLDLDELDPLVRTAAKEAQAWLARLGAAMRAEDQVMALPYGDIDVAAAAGHSPELYQRAVTRAGTTLPGFDVTTTPVVAPPSGYLSTEGIRATDPGTTILLTDAMFEAPAPAVADVEGHRVVVAPEGAAAGGPGPDSRTAPVAMRQRLLSEAAVRFLRGAHAPLTMVLPHDWNPSDDGASFFSGLDADWLDLTSVTGVTGSTTSTSVVGSTLRYPKWQEEAELDQPNFDAADLLIRSGAALQNLLTLNNLVSGTVTDQALGSTSYSARAKPIISRASADQSRTWIDDRLGQVHVLGPRAVTLSSSSGRFQATISNDLDQPVTVSLEAKADGNLTIDGPRRVDVPANGRQAVLLTARTDENGIHEVTLLVTDKRGTPLGASTGLTIRSAQVSNVIWIFVGTGLALLFGAIGLRLFRRVRNARRTPAEPEDAPAGPDDQVDSGVDAGVDAGADAGVDAGVEPSEPKESAGAGTR